MARLRCLVLCFLAIVFMISCGQSKGRHSSEVQPSEFTTDSVGKPITNKVVLTPSSPSEFNKIISGSGRVSFVYFWATWCGQCIQYNGVAKRVINEALNRSELKNFAIISADYDKVLNDFTIDDMAEGKKALEIKQKFAVIGTPNMFLLIDGEPVKYVFTTNDAKQIVDELTEISTADKNSISTMKNEFNLAAKKRNSDSESN